MTGQSPPAQPWPAPHPFPAGRWPSGYDQPAPWPSGQVPPVGSGPAHSFPPAPGFAGPWPPGQWGAHPVPPGPPPAPGRRRAPVAVVSVLLLLLLAVGGAAWAVNAGHLTGVPGVPGVTGTSSDAPLAAPAPPAAPRPAGPVAVPGSGDFCSAVRASVTEQTAALNDPNTDIRAVIESARATNRRLAAVAPAELRADFAVFLEVSDQLADMMTSGTAAGPESLQGMLSPRFQAAVENITTYVSTRCGLQFDALSPPGLAG